MLSQDKYTYQRWFPWWLMAHLGGIHPKGCKVTCLRTHLCLLLTNMTPRLLRSNVCSQKCLYTPLQCSGERCSIQLHTALSPSVFILVLSYLLTSSMGSNTLTWKERDASRSFLLTTLSFFWRQVAMKLSERHVIDNVVVFVCFECNTYCVWYMHVCACFHYMSTPPLWFHVSVVSLHTIC
jgi:hypothetical protein